MPNCDSRFPRAASLTTARSFTSCQPSRNDDTAARSLVSLSIMTAMPTPQSGWHPQLSWPHS